MLYLQRALDFGQHVLILYSEFISPSDAVVATYLPRAVGNDVSGSMRLIKHAT